MNETTAAQKNRRALNRQRAKNSTKVICRKGSLDLGPNLAVALLDVSESGVRLLLRAPLMLGQEVSISLEGQANVRPVTRSGNMAWAVDAEQGTCCVGVRFEKYLTHRDLQLLANGW